MCAAVSALCPFDRDPFIFAVAAELEGQPIGDGTIGRAIRAVQPKFAHPEPAPVPARWQRDKPRFEHTGKRRTCRRIPIPVPAISIEPSARRSRGCGCRRISPQGRPAAPRNIADGLAPRG
jgi:hypothetical protein